MYIKQNEYFTVKEDTAEAIDIIFSLREKSISNIARLYDDEVPCCYNESDRYISEIIFEASGISVGENTPVALTSELFIDSKPEVNPATAVRRLALDRF